MHLNHQYQIQELQMYEKSNKKSYEVNFYNTISINHRNVASVNSQNTRVNIHVNNANTQIVLNEIEKQTDYLFVYDTKEIDLNRKVSVEAQNKTVQMCYHLSLPKQTSHMRWRVITSC